MSAPTLLILLAFSGCATFGPKPRVAGAALSGGASAAMTATALSPNSESRALNALVFGLAGALVGGGIAVWRMPDPSKVDATPDLRTRELSDSPAGPEYLVKPSQELPDYLKKRVQPAVIEEFEEKDSVSEEGTLHEPHKAYRIKRPAELIARPNREENGGSK